MKKVLLFAPFGQFAVHHQLDAVLGAALRLRGCEVQVVTCDGIFSTCDVLAWAGSNAAKVCQECAAKSKNLFGKFALPIRQLRSFLSASDFDEARRWALSLDVERYASATFEDKPIGEWATSSVFSHFRITSSSLHRPEVRRVHQDYLVNALLTWKSLTRVLKEFPADSMVIFNGRMAPYRVAFEVARALGIRVLGHERGMTPGAFTLYENSSCCEPESIFHYIEQWLRVPLSESDIQRCLEITRRETGAHLNYPAFYDFQTQASEALSALNIPLGSKILGVFTSSEFELANNRSYGSVTSQLEYVDRLIEVFRNRQDYLVIRHHPNIAGDANVVADHDFLKRAWHQAQNAPKNVRVVMPSEKLTSYALIPHLSGAIAFFSSTGQESIARGIAAAAMPQSYSHQSATFQITDTSVEGLAKLVDQLFDKTAAFEATDLRSCYRYISASLNRHSSKFKGLDIKNFFDADIKLSHEDDLLPGGDSELDKACEFIINGTPIFTGPTPEHLQRDTSVEQAFFVNELKRIQDSKAISPKQTEAGSAVPDPISVTPVAVLQLEAATNGEPSWAERSRHQALHFFPVHTTSQVPFLNALAKALEQVTEPFTLVAPEQISLDESLIRRCVSILLSDGSADLDGVRFGAWVARGAGGIQGEIFTPRSFIRQHFDACELSSLFRAPASILSLAIHRTEHLRRLVERALNAPSEEDAAKLLFEAVQEQSYHDLQAPLAMFQETAQALSVTNQTPPILFLVFNRYDLTQQVFEEIKAQKPAKLFIAADGPRRHIPGEKTVCDSIRQMLIQRVDWDCEVKTLFRDSNLGCKEAVASAIDWFFENVEEGIILEDDCLPEPDFFRFCSQLLERYRDEPSVMQIAGVNFQHGRQRGADSYYFSKYPHIWGWATWRRAWCHYDIAATGLDEFLSSSAWKQLCPLKEEAEYWAPLLRQVRDGHVDTWDFQWTYAVWKNSGLTAIPQVNLIANIGFRGDATHTVDPSTKLSRMATRPLADLTSGPTTLVADAEADAFTFLHTFTSEASRKALSRARKQIQPDNRLTKASKKESELLTIKSSLAWRVIGKPLYSIEKRLFKPSRKD